MKTVEVTTFKLTETHLKSIAFTRTTSKDESYIALWSVLLGANTVSHIVFNHSHMLNHVLYISPNVLSKLLFSRQTVNAL